MLTNTIIKSTDLSKMDKYNVMNYNNGENLEKAIEEFGKLVLSYPDAWAMVHTVNDNPIGINDEHGRACPSVFHFSRAVVAIL